MKIIPVILCGGSGTRLWPISRTKLPKQFSDFFGTQSLFQKTVLRYNSDKEFTPPLIICNEEHRFIVASQLQEINVKYLAIILEPNGRNTASAIAIASLYLEKNYPSHTMVVSPADHLINDDKAFIECVTSALEASCANKIITFGIKPQYPETGYGYIEKSEAIQSNSEIFNVAKFIEKPSLEIAKNLIKDNKYFWNSGIFMLRVDLYLAELKKFESEILHHCQKSFEKAKNDLDFIRIEAVEFSKCKNISVDYAVLEKSSNIALKPIDIGWSDVGSWGAISNLASKDKDNNSLIGNVVNHNIKNCYINSNSGQLIATTGIDNLIITATKDVILIANKNNLGEIKDLYNQAQHNNPSYCNDNFKIMRPWGSFEVIDVGNNYKVKKISVKPHASLSLQLHKKRAEHWVVVKGVAHVECEDKKFTLNENESTFIPLGKKHRLENKSDDILEIIEIQSGEYLEEDDIERFNDKYGR